MIGTLTARRLKPGAYEPFRSSWDVGGVPEGWTRVYHCRDVDDPDVVLSFGLFDGTLEQLREAQARLGRQRAGRPDHSARRASPARRFVRGRRGAGLLTEQPTAEQLLSEARARLHRLSPEEAATAVPAGALLLDIRSEVQRERDGAVPGAREIPRNVFEWRCDPSSDWNDAEVVGNPERRLIVMGNEGCQSSLAAVTLQRFGFADATDVIGGFQAWRAAGLELMTTDR